MPSVCMAAVTASDSWGAACLRSLEAFKALGENRYLAVFLALMVAATVFIISWSYRRIIEEFPHGGGGYLVATKHLGPYVGAVSGSALLVDAKSGRLNRAWLESLGDDLARAVVTGGPQPAGRDHQISMPQCFANRLLNGVARIRHRHLPGDHMAEVGQPAAQPLLVRV